MWEPADARRWPEPGAGASRPTSIGLGDSTDRRPGDLRAQPRGAWTGSCAALDLGRVALVVHDWGGFVGLAWACDHPDRIEALVISDTGFFTDGKWHGMAEAVRGEQGEETRRGARPRRVRRAAARAGDHASTTRRSTHTGRRSPTGAGSGRRSSSTARWTSQKLEPWQGKLAELGVPTLLLWGAEDDPFAPLGGARRFEREIPGATPRHDRGRRALRLRRAARALRPRGPRLPRPDPRLRG